MADDFPKFLRRAEPDPEAWDRVAKQGDLAVRKALRPAVIRAAKQEAGPYAGLAVGMGALVAVGELLAAITKGGYQRVVEEMTAAYLRGALRGAEQPLNADGTPYTGARLDA